MVRASRPGTRETDNRRHRARRVAVALLVCVLAAAPGASAQLIRKSQTPLPESSFWGTIVTSWTQAFDAIPTGPPAFDATHAYVALRDDRVAAVSLQTGAVVWSVTQKSSAPPAVVDGVVLVPDGTALVALSPATGKVTWRQDVGAECTAAPATAPNAIAVLTARPELVLLRPKDGTVSWRLALKKTARTAATIDARRVYAGLLDGTVVGVDLKSGAPQWTRPIGGEILRLTLDGDRLRVGTTDDFIYSVNADSGRVVFRWRTGGDVRGAVVSDAKRVYFASMDNSLTALGRGGGDMKWQQRLPSRPVDGPVLFGNTVMLASVAGDLRLFEVDEGRLLDTITLPGRPIDRPHIVPASGITTPQAVMLTAGGQLFSIGPQGEPPLATLDPMPGNLILGVESFLDVEPPLVPMVYPPGRLLPPETLPSVPVKKRPAP